MKHTCKRGQDGVLHDGCPRCAELTDIQNSYGLNAKKMAELWAEMIAVEIPPRQLGRYASEADAIAAIDLYNIALWLRKYTNVDPRTLKVGP
jgi:hypothetical protein